MAILRPKHLLKHATFVSLFALFVTPSSAIGQEEEIVAPKGAARRWQASIPVGVYSQVNLQTGRVLTTLPITSWSGRGPSIYFALYHNQCSAWETELPEIEENFALRGDANQDGAFNASDIDSFFELLLEPVPTEAQVAAGDFTHDDVVDVDDVPYFFINLELQDDCDGPNWRHSYSARLWETGKNELTLVRDDGTQDIFLSEDEGDSFQGPPGTFEAIYRDFEVEGPTLGFLLVTKAHTKAYFYGDDYLSGALWGRLAWVADAAIEECSPTPPEEHCHPLVVQPLNKVNCEYDIEPLNESYLKLARVTDASGRALDLIYNYSTNGNLAEIHAPLDGETYRAWELLYHDDLDPDEPKPSADGPFEALADAMGFRIWWTYTGEWDIESITDKNWDWFGAPTTRSEHSFTLEYTGGRLTKITDPDHKSGLTVPGGLPPLDDPAEQTFVYEITLEGLFRTTYIDRRGKTWYFRFNKYTANFMSMTDPLDHTRSFEYHPSTALALIHEVVKYTNALGKEWTSSYDENGNLIKRTDPLGHTWAWEYDSLNNLVAITPPLNDEGDPNPDKATTIHYENELLPTSPTKIIQPDTDQDDPVETTLVYYEDPEEDHGFGQLFQVIDPNGVLTRFEYDEFGQRKAQQGGLAVISGLGGPGQVPEFYADFTTPNNAGFTDGETGGPHGGADVNSDANGRPTGTSDCLVVLTTPTPNDGSAWGTPPFPAMNIATMKGCGWSLDYDRMDNVTSSSSLLADTFASQDCGSGHRTITMEAEYDELHQPWTSSITTNEPGANIARGFTTVPYLTEDFVKRVGPDGHLTTTTFDDAGRVTVVQREGIVTEYEYDEADRLERVVNANNGTETVITYDDASRVTSVHDKISGGDTILKRDFTEYSPDGLILTIEEFEDDGEDPDATITYVYDKLNRLTEEHRDGGEFGISYDRVYTYDAGGNRLTKNDGTYLTTYTYDIDDWEEYGSNDNRLLKYEVREILTTDLIETVWYTYAVQENYTGDVRQIIRHRPDEGEGETYHRTWFNFDGAGRVWMVMNDTYEWDGDPGHAPTNIQKLAAREFRYHSGRARYLMRDRHPNTLELLGDPHEGVWTDYDGETVYGDYRLELSENVLTPERLNDYMPGAYTTTTVPPFPTTQPFESTEWYHTDQVGSTRAMTTEPVGQPAAPQAVRRRIYTAFGEAVQPPQVADPGGNRYGYCGAWGYESDWSGDLHAASLWGEGFDSPCGEFGGDAAGLVHVGARWYEPATGQFIQRDPIGIRGGLNVYGYAGNDPVLYNDPTGFDRYVGGGIAHTYAVIQDPARNGRWYRIDYWAASESKGWLGLLQAFFWSRGCMSITVAGPPAGGIVESSSPSQDAEALRVAGADIANPPNYSVIGSSSCHNHAQKIRNAGMLITDRPIMGWEDQYGRPHRPGSM